MIAYQDDKTKILQGDVRAMLKTLPDRSVQTCVTSPPYWGLRDYQVDGQIGLEPTPEAYVQTMVEVFREVKRVLKDDGTLWLNLGSSYAGSWGNYHPDSPPGKHGQRLKETARWNRPAYQSQDFLPATANVKGYKPKDMVPIPWMVAMALQADGWYLRCDIIWSKPNPMPESVRDRPTKAHEYLFLLSDRWDQMTKQEQCAGLRNKRSIWTVATHHYAEAHFATFPPKLIEPCILAGAPSGGVVLDCFHGAGTTALVSKQHALSPLSMVNILC